jgi:spore coat protein U-like protein
MRSLIALLLLPLLAPLTARAQAATCRIRLSGLDFGTYRSLDRTPDTVLGRLDVLCTADSANGATPHVTISAGNSGQFAERTMTFANHLLRYNLYAEPTRRLVLGDGSAGTAAFATPRARTRRSQSWPIFGLIAPGQRVPAGIYTDTLLIEVEF